MHLPVSAGATALIPSELFPAAADPKGAYVAPQVLVNVNAEMDVVKVGFFLYLLQGTLGVAVFPPSLVRSLPPSLLRSSPS